MPFPFRAPLAGVLAAAIASGAALLAPSTASAAPASAPAPLGAAESAWDVPRGGTAWVPLLLMTPSEIHDDFSMSMTLTDGYSFASIIDDSSVWVWSGDIFEQSNWYSAAGDQWYTMDCSLSQAKTRIDCDVEFEPTGFFLPGTVGVMVRISSPQDAPATSMEWKGIASGTPQKRFETATVDSKSRLPITQADTATTRQNRPVDVDVLANDTANDVPGTALDPDSLKLVSGGSLTDTANVAGGTVSVVGGELRFTPDASFTGTMGRATYSIADSDGVRNTSTATVDVTPITPVAEDDSAVIWQGATTDLRVLANDEPGDPTVPLAPDSVQLSGGTDGGKRLEVSGEGTYSVSDDGNVEFAAAPSFTGATSPVEYTVADANGTTAAATIGITVSAVTPTATDDTAVTLQGQPVTIDVLDNDTAGQPDVPLDPSSLTITDGADQQDVGTFAVSGDAVVFTPAAAFTGDATATYSVADANGTTTTATVTVTVGAVTPALGNDTATTIQGKPVTIDVLTNDAPGDDTAPLDEDTLTLTGTDDAFELVDGKIRYTPAKTFTGDATTTYTVTDANGTVGTATVTVTVTPVTPTATDDTADTLQGQPVTIDVLDNDTAGDPTVPLDADSLTLTTADPGFTVQDDEIHYAPTPTFTGDATATYSVADANGTTTTATVTVTVGAVTPALGNDTATTIQGKPVTIDVLTNDAPGDDTAPLDEDTLTIVAGEDQPGLGVFSVADGRVTFTPVLTATGDVTATYSIADANGTTATATVTVSVTPVTPVAVDDAVASEQGDEVIADVLANDHAGDAAVRLDPATLQLVTTDGLVDQIERPGTGVLQVTDGTIVFTPDVAFTGTTDVTYQVADANGTTTSATARFTVAAVVPVVVPDTASTMQGRSVSIDLLANDEGGREQTPLDPSFVTLVAPGERLDGEDSETLDHVAMPGAGTWTLDGTTATFAPEPDFTGEALVTYAVTDMNGTTMTSTATVAVEDAGLHARADHLEGPEGEQLSGDVLANDEIGHGGAIDAATLRFVDGERTSRTLVVDGQGTWRIDGRSVVFTPQAGFVGTTDPVTYTVDNTDGVTTSAEVEAELIEEAAPTPTPLELAFTGATGITAGLLALGAMALGGLLLLLRRRRHAE